MKKQLTPQDYQERDTARRADAKAAIDSNIQALLADVKAGKSERLVQWMNFCSAFHRYSSANLWLLASQLHARGVEPSFIASYNDWLRIGKERHGKPYQVRKGEKALTIWVPRIYNKKDESESEEVKTHMSFLIKPCVFDASQIDQGEDQPPLDHFWEKQADSESAQALYDVLRAYATSQGFTCHEEELPASTQGYSQGEKIVVKVGLDSTTAVNTFIHELAHGIMHQRPQTPEEGEAPLQKRDRECEQKPWLLSWRSTSGSRMCSAPTISRCMELTRKF